MYGDTEGHTERHVKQIHSARSWNVKIKILISLGAIMSYFTITLATSIYIASIPGIMQEFNIGQTLAISPITLYAMGFVIGPILTSAFSEEFGRQYIYKISLLLHLIFTTIGGSAANFRTLAVARAMAGILGSPCVSIFAGVLNDIWEPDDKIATLLFALYGLGGITATSIGPISGEAIVTDRGWRWSFWLIAILVGICFLSMLFVPETYFPEIKRQVLKVPRKSLKNTFKVALTRPLHMLFVEPVILPTAAIVTVGQIVIFVFYASYPVVLQNTYGFSDYSIGLAFLPLLVGNIFSLPVLAVLEKRRAKLPVRVPEQRLVAGMIAGILMPVGLFWLAWTARPSVHWIVPLLAGVPYGLGFALSQLVYPIYKNELYGAELGASAFALDVAMRYIFSSVFPLFAIQMIKKINETWTITLFAFVLIALAPVPWVLQKWGPTLRSKSKYVAMAQGSNPVPTEELRNS